MHVMEILSFLDGVVVSVFRPYFLSLPAQTVDFLLLEKIITIVADHFQPRKDTWVVDTTALEVHIAPLLDAEVAEAVGAEAMVAPLELGSTIDLLEAVGGCCRGIKIRQHVGRGREAARRPRPAVAFGCCGRRHGWCCPGEASHTAVRGQSKAERQGGFDGGQ